VAEHDIRVSDAERDRAARRLRDHCAAGRLTIEELDTRVEAVYTATTRDELARAVADLPIDEAADAPHRPERRFFWPGIAAFHEERHLASTCPESYGAALREMVPRMGMQGFHIVDELWPRRLRFASATGLFVTVMFHPAADGGTNVSAFGHGPRAVRKAFATLRD
jgi:hypothetical protein